MFWETLSQRNGKSVFLRYKLAVDLGCYFIVKYCSMGNIRKRGKSTGIEKLDTESADLLHERHRV